MSTTHEEKMEQLDLLFSARELLPEEEIAQRAREILDGPISIKIASTHRVGIAEFLMRKGYSGPDTARLIVDFERAVAMAYVEYYGEYPPRDEGKVYVFDTADLPLIERIYTQKIEDICEAVGVMPV